MIPSNTTPHSRHSAQAEALASPSPSTWSFLVLHDNLQRWEDSCSLGDENRAQAVNRILSCYADPVNRRELDLSGIRLRSLPDGIAALTTLEKLHLDENQMAMMSQLPALPARCRVYVNGKPLEPSAARGESNDKADATSAAPPQRAGRSSKHPDLVALGLKGKAAREHMANGDYTLRERLSETGRQIEKALTKPFSSSKEKGE